jgi:putative ABC transport system permease protein
MTLLPFDYAIRNLGRSPRRLALVAGGSMLVALLAILAIGFSRGLASALASSGLESNALVLGSGSEESAERSEIPPTVRDVLVGEIDGLPMVAGEPAASSEIHAALPTRGPATGTLAPPMPVRGFENAAFLVHPQVALAEGRWPARGRDEVSLGLEAKSRLGACIGDTVEIAGHAFEVCGFHAARGTAMHGEVWMRIDRLAQLTQRTTHSCVVVALGDAEFDDIDAFTASRLDLETVAMRESEYYARIAEFFKPIRILVAITAFLIALGGALGGIHAMYAAFSTRVREAATLQALGFSRAAIALSLVLESTVACLAGALAACAVGLVALDGLAVHFSMGSFAVSVDSAAIAGALAAGLLLGLFGAIPAILRCLTLSIPTALRS